jgi:hypothetical protein
MKVIFGEAEKKLSISECDFENVEIFKDGVAIADIPLTNGEGFIINAEILSLDDEITLYPYNTVVMVLE